MSTRRGDSDKPSSGFQSPRNPSEGLDVGDVFHQSPPMPLTDMRRTPDTNTTQLAVSGETPPPASLLQPRKLFSKLAGKSVLRTAKPKVAAQRSELSSFEKA